MTSYQKKADLLLRCKATIEEIKKDAQLLKIKIITLQSMFDDQDKLIESNNLQLQKFQTTMISIFAPPKNPYRKSNVDATAQEFGTAPPKVCDTLDECKIFLNVYTPMIHTATEAVDRYEKAVELQKTIIQAQNHAILELERSSHQKRVRSISPCRSTPLLVKRKIVQNSAEQPNAVGIAADIPKTALQRKSPLQFE